MHAASHATERAMSISGAKNDHVARSPADDRAGEWRS